MKKYGFFAIIMILTIPLYGQTKTKNYEIIFELSTSQKDEVSRVNNLSAAINENFNVNFPDQMEKLFEVFNRVFMFSPDTGDLPMKVQVFSDTAAYDAFLESANAHVNISAIYLHYSQRERCLLAVDASAAYEASLPYQAFIQYLRAFIPHPPLWLQKGFANFFSTLSFNEDNLLSFPENLNWLPIVKNIERSSSERPSIEEILTSFDNTSLDENIFDSYAASLASFFINSGNQEYKRAFTDSLMTLSKQNSMEQNTEAVMRRLFLTRSAEELANDLIRYVSTRKTFLELVTEGREAYSNGDMESALLSFRTALEMNNSHFVTWYYLGLLAYEANNYNEAHQYYLTAIEKGADRALVYYALGINAAAAARNAEAVDYLRRAAQISPERYEEKSQNIIRRLR